MSASRLPLPKGSAAGLSALSGAIYFLGFAGFNIWPLAFLAFVPLYIALQGQSPKRSLLLGWIMGTVMNVGGFYWLLNMLRTFSGFPTVLCAFFMLLVCAYQGGIMGLLAWIYARATARGWPAAIAFAAAFVASEFLYPVLFPWYFGASVHRVPVLMQTAELGGPVLVGLTLVSVNIAIAEVIVSRLAARPVHRPVLRTALAAFVFTVLFGLWRVRATDARVAAAEPLHVGTVQGNMGLMQKREDPAEGLRRHLRLTRELKDKGAELVVWSESSVTFWVPENLTHSLMKQRVGAHLGLPGIWGGVVYRVDPDRERWFNTALSSDAQGNITGRYDKHFLLAFGEYLPLGEMFPILYKWSPNSGKFSPGREMTPLVVPNKGRDHQVAALICYEDILPSFTNRVVAATKPELLVNITNDAWFGDTAEPWQHLALAQFRAIEHRRFLVRSTNTGVSAIVDPVGRLVAVSGTFKAQSLDAVVRWMQSSTVYEAIGDIPMYLVTAWAVVMAFLRRREGALWPVWGNVGGGSAGH